MVLGEGGKTTRRSCRMKPENLITIMQKFDCFSDLSEKELALFEKYAYWRNYPKGQLLFTEGDPREKIYFLIDGYIKIHKENESATLSYNSFIGPNKVFPLEGLFYRETYIFSAKAVTDVNLVYIPSRLFEDLIRHNTKQLVQIIQCYSRTLELHEARLQLLTKATAQDRVIHIIHYLMESVGNEEDGEIVIQCPLTSTDLAEISGTSRKTVSDVIKSLKDEHILTINHKTITIHKPDYLQRSAL